MCGIVGIVGKSDVAQRLFDGLKRLEYRGYDSRGHLHDRSTASSSGAGRRASSTISPRELDGEPLHGEHRHRAYALGDARRADRRQCPPAHRRQRRAGPQRHHREFQAAPRRADRRRAQVRERDRHGSRRPPRRARDRARRIARGGGRDGAAAAAPARSPSPSCSATTPTCSSAPACGAPLTVGYGDGENYLGSDALAVAPWTQRIAYLDEGDWAVVHRDRHRDLRPRQPARQARDRRVRRVLGAGREGQLPPLTCRRRFSSSRSWLPRLSRATSARSRARSRCRSAISISPASTAAHHRRLRHQLLRRARRQILARAVRARAGRHRCRQRIPLPRAGAGAGRAGAVHQPVGRDRGHAGRASPRAGASSSASRSSSMCRPARWRARRTCCFRPTPGRRSASPRPRRSLASWRCWPRLPPTSPAPRDASAATKSARSSGISRRRRRR